MKESDRDRHQDEMKNLIIKSQDKAKGIDIIRS